MRKLGIEPVDSATQRVLQKMATVEQKGLRYDENFVVSHRLQRWLDRWLPRLGEH